MKRTKLSRAFFTRDTETVARELLGKILVHDSKEGLVRARIMETEAYLGITDRACHSYGGKRTERTEVMYSIGGTAYVYLIYGMYCCFNVVTEKAEVPEAVLIRAAVPLENEDLMARRRFGATFSELTPAKKRALSDGPGKICIALGIDRSHNYCDLTGSRLYVEEDGWRCEIEASPRIGIDYAGEAKEYLLRFTPKKSE